MHATDGTVSMLVNTLTCDLEVFTIDAGALPGTRWFSQSVSTKVDGGSTENKFSGYQGYWTRLSGVHTFG